MNRRSPETLPRRRRFSLAANLAVSACAVIVAVGLGEVALRWLVPHRPPLVVTQESRELFVKSPIAGLGYELRPAFKGRAFGCDVAINSHGMRSPERPVAKPSNVRRIFILGDSVAFGHGVAQDSIFPAILEKILAEATLQQSKAAEAGLQQSKIFADGATTRCVEVINAAVPGYNTVQQEIVLREKAAAWQPDVVLVVAVVNDAEPAYELGDDGMLRWENPPEVYREFIERTIAGKGWRAFARQHLRLAALLDSARPHFLTRKYLDYLDQLYADESAGWKEAQQALKSMSALCRARRTAFVLAFCPVPETPEPEVLKRIRLKFGEFARSQGIHFVDLFDAEHCRPVAEVVLSLLDRHPNALGHRLIAEALAQALRAELNP